jgi:hypothetical protein
MGVFSDIPVMVINKKPFFVIFFLTVGFLPW